MIAQSHEALRRCIEASGQYSIWQLLRHIDPEIDFTWPRSLHCFL